MSAEDFYARYRDWQQRRVISRMTNPWWIAAFTAFTWIFFRWWPAVLLTAWFGVCVVLAFRERRSGV
jgi:energy-converting hydrogenase Eha subunit G